MQLFSCPICQGRQMVSPGFYGPVGANITFDKEICRSCKGKGYIIVDAETTSPVVGFIEVKGIYKDGIFEIEEANWRIK